MFRLANPKDREKALGSRKLLLIDDDSDVVTLAGQILANAGYSVFSTSDPGEAIRLLSDRRVRIDLLITDVFMPGMTGPDLARTGFRNRAELRVLFMSGDTKARSTVRKGDNYLVKPFASAELVREVSTTLIARHPTDAEPYRGTDRRKSAERRKGAAGGKGRT